MSQSIRQTIEELKRHLAEIESEAADTKRTINSLCRRIGEPLPYGDGEVIATPVAQALHGDEFVNKALATAVQMILKSRKTANLGPATVDELYDALAAGGYEFESKEPDAKRGLTISLAKNTPTFYKLSNGKFGLGEWYGKDQKSRAGNGAGRKSKGATQVEQDDLEMENKERELQAAGVNETEETAVDERLPAKAK